MMPARKTTNSRICARISIVQAIAHRSKFGPRNGRERVGGSQPCALTNGVALLARSSRVCSLPHARSCSLVLCVSCLLRREQWGSGVGAAARTRSAARLSSRARDGAEQEASSERGQQRRVTTQHSPLPPALSSLPRRLASSIPSCELSTKRPPVDCAPRGALRTRALAIDSILRQGAHSLAVHSDPIPEGRAHHERASGAQRPNDQKGSLRPPRCGGRTSARGSYSWRCSHHACAHRWYLS